jgi:aminoglycoside 6'-N-acetyltransferase
MPPTLRDGDITLRPIGEGDLDPLLAIIGAPGVAEWWTPIDDLEHEREGLCNEGHAFAIEVGGELAGWLAFDEEEEPDYRHASLDIFLAPDYQDRGLGRRALRLAAGWLIGERKHHRLTIDPAAHNARAIRTYSAVGFRPVGVMRRYERGADGSWHDGLLMDLIEDELLSSG